jgi:PTS system N-acetylgalactosamine-specific IIA component/PTS system mannose-specific IIA component
LSKERTIKGIIIGHGGLAQALLDAAEKIIGPQDEVETLSNAGLSGDALCGRIVRLCKKSKKDQIVFVDLPGGSCTISCMKVLRKKKNVHILCGMNLPMLLEFFLLRHKFPARELVEILIKKATNNIFQVGGDDNE